MAGDLSHKEMDDSPIAESLQKVNNVKIDYIKSLRGGGQFKVISL